ncbi:LutC/YkgG family protein [Actinomadura rudentiformis]|uniref:Lactate utilization protein C n=1 Tax=Actinomadura rudentiformis TaxID=359158 RepID=A0A6H9YXC3_9ACTN|nr:LUD domain-containing protein [Actinomadura rudentiformis]KAB2346482.1 lactate utilization protein C [Actinomadura rudentiformis]
MSTRDQILAKVRAALADVPADERPEDVAVPRDYQRSRAGTDIVDLLIDRLVDYKAVVHHTASAAVGAAGHADASGVADAVVARLLVARGGRIGAPVGVPEEWLEGVDAVRDDPVLPAAELDALDGVVTGCALAIAETGTIVLDGSPDQGRRALTLVPDHHLCVVRLDQIVRTVPEALARLDPSRPLTWISGPSATSDIELDRVEGVHGPRTLEVVII